MTDHPCVMFADDATIFITDNKLDGSNICNELCSTLRIVINWLASLHLRVNLDKTKCIQFSKNKQATQDLNINIDSKRIEQVNSTNWKLHTEKINKKIASSCYAISILIKVTSVEVAKQAYYGNVYPQLTYGVIFWGNSVNVQSTFILQKRCLRLIFNVKTRESLRPVFKRHRMLTLTCIYILEICLFIRQRKDLFIKKCDSKENLRSQYQYDLCTVRPTSYILKKSTYATGIKIYNKLPANIKLLDGSKFKRNLKDWLICKCFYDLNEYFL